ncbi:membrane metallo-endopeptidase-like 1 [Dermacentor andersoni]|uniref:membrane metallo-endopeptidase-like 1 n=1 Tax=Dermacentor andersoni TaxID=34620 RepID=UPI00215520A6|nr:membrane metallo-endopeptidase-like 1 [Dermacentor andersoni]
MALYDQLAVAIRAEEFAMCSLEPDSVGFDEPTGAVGPKALTSGILSHLDAALEARSLVVSHAFPDVEKRIQQALIAAATFIAIAAVAAVLLLSRKRQPQRVEELCRTEDCQQHASLLLRNMNTSIDPCDDLYGHVCSRWLPDSRYRDYVKSTLDELRFAWYKDFNTSLYRGTLALPVGMKARAMYDSCMGTESQYGESVAQFLEVLQQYGLRWPGPPLPNVNALGVLIALDVDLQAAFWFTVTTWKLGSTRVIALSHVPSISLLLRHHQSVSSSGMYARYWKNFETVFLNDSMPPTTDAEIERAARIEADILKRLVNASEAQPKSAAEFKAGAIDRYTKPLSSEEWIMQLNAKMNLGSAIASSDKMISDDIGYLKEIGRIFATYSNEELLTHLAWHVVQEYAVVSSYRFFRARFGSVEAIESHRPIFCGANVEVSYKALVLALHIASKFQAEERDRVMEAFESLKLTLSAQLNASSWIDMASKKLLGKKASLLDNRLWPLPKFLDKDVLEAIYFDFPYNEPSFGEYWVNTRRLLRKVRQRVSDYEHVLELPDNNSPEYFSFNYMQNSLGTALGGVARPLFYPSGTMAMLYGGLGFSMALQMVKTLDSEGLRWKPSRGLGYSIMSKSTMTTYHAKESCLKKNGFPSIFPEIPALDIAYVAYEKANKHDRRIDRNLSNDKVFFLTLCYMTCTSREQRRTSSADCNKALLLMRYLRTLRCIDRRRLPACVQRVLGCPPPLSGKVRELRGRWATRPLLTRRSLKHEETTPKCEHPASLVSH